MKWRLPALSETTQTTRSPGCLSASQTSPLSHYFGIPPSYSPVLYTAPSCLVPSSKWGRDYLLHQILGRLGKVQVGWLSTKHPHSKSWHPSPSPVPSQMPFPTIQLWWTLPSPPENTQNERNPGQTDQKTREEKEAKEQNTNPIKANSGISAQTFNYPKPSYVEASMKTQQTIAKTLCHHQNPAIILQQVLDLPT